MEQLVACMRLSYNIPTQVFVYMESCRSGRDGNNGCSKLGWFVGLAKIYFSSLSANRGL